MVLSTGIPRADRPTGDRIVPPSTAGVGAVVREIESDLVRVARLERGDRVLLPDRTSWGWVTVTDVEGSSGTGFVYLLEVWLPLGARARASRTIWRHGWDRVHRWDRATHPVEASVRLASWRRVLMRRRRLTYAPSMPAAHHSTP